MQRAEPWGAWVARGRGEEWPWLASDAELLSALGVLERLIM